MLQVPGAFDVANRHPLTVPARLSPDSHRSDPVRRGMEITLRGLEVAAARSLAFRSRRRRGHHGRDGARGDVGVLDRVRLLQASGEPLAIGGVLGNDLDELLEFAGEFLRHYTPL